MFDSIGGVKNASDARAVKSRHKILEAAAELMVERGVDSLNVKAIAERAGVQRSTIYNHWPNQADLVLAAMEHFAHRSAAAPQAADSGEAGPLDDVVQLARSVGINLASGWGSVAAGLAAAAEHDDTLAVAHRTFVQSRRNELAAMIADHCAVGRLRPNIDPNWAVSLLIGPMYYERLVMHQAMTPDEIDAHLATTLRALAND